MTASGPHAPPPLAARGFTRRHEQMEMGGSAQLRLPFLPCTGIDNHCHLQKEQNTTTSCPLFFSVFYICIPQIRLFGVLFLLRFKSPARKRTRTRGASPLWKRGSWVCHRLKEMMTVLPRRWIWSVVAAVEGNRRRMRRVRCSMISLTPGLKRKGNRSLFFDGGEDSN